MPQTPDDPNRKNQIDKFREAARELETDDSEERFAETVRRIGTAKPIKGPPGQDRIVKGSSK